MTCKRRILFYDCVNVAGGTLEQVSAPSGALESDSDAFDRFLSSLLGVKTGVRGPSDAEEEFSRSEVVLRLEHPPSRFACPIGPHR